MTLSDISEFLQQAEQCTSQDELAGLFYEAGEDSDNMTNTLIFSMLSDKKKPSLSIGEDLAALGDKVIACPKCKNTSVHTLLASAKEVLSNAKPLHFGCCECGTQFLI